MKDQIILVVPPYTYRTNAYLNAAEKLGIDAVCAIDPSYGVPGSVEHYLPMAIEQPVDSARALVNYASTNPVRAVVSIDDGGGVIAALAAEQLGFPHNLVQAIHASNNKHCMRVLLERAKVPSPSFTLLRICEDPVRISRNINYPVVLKPLFLTGSRGVIRANDPDEFTAAFARVARLLMEPGTGPDPKSMLVEEYIPGFEVSLEGVLVDGDLLVLGLYDKPDPLEGPFFEETMFVKPSRLPGEVQDSIIKCAGDALKAVGLRVGPFQVELRVNERGPWIVELAARTMGGHCSRALPFKGKLSLEELVLSQAAGLDMSRFIPEPGAHGVMMIPIPGEGVYRGVHGVEEAEAVPGITGVMMSIAVGSTITPLPEGDKYIGFIFANGDTPDDVEKALRVAHAHLKFDIAEVTRVVLRLKTMDTQEIIRAQFGAVAEAHLSPFCKGLDTGRAREFYDDAATRNLPRSATAAALGCGNPSAHADFQPGETVVDLGCGGGIDSLIAAGKVGKTGRVIGIDMTDSMVLLSRQNQAKMGLENVDFLKAPIENVPLPDASADVIISNNTVNLSPDKDALFAEIFRLLRPGGRFVICDVVADDALTDYDRFDVFTSEGCLNGALGRHEYRSKLDAAGFENAAIQFEAPYGVASSGLSTITVLGRKPRPLES